LGGGIRLNLRGEGKGKKEKQKVPGQKVSQGGSSVRRARKTSFHLRGPQETPHIKKKNAVGPTRGKRKEHRQAILP